MSGINDHKLKVSFCSDLHQEFDDIDLDKFQGTGDVLLLCGDICNIVSLLERNKAYISYDESSNIIDFFDLVTNNYRRVIWVLGNHEYYLMADIEESPRQLRDALKRYSNLEIVTDGKLVVVDSVAFVCGTMWTDFNNKDPITLMNANRMIADYRQIKNGESLITTFDILNKHEHFIKWITNLDLFGYSNAVLVTHHSPSFKCVHPIYKDERIMNGLFTSNLDYLLSKFDYCFHGHMHDPIDTEVNECRILSSPRGYPNEFQSYNFEVKQIEM